MDHQNQVIGAVESVTDISEIIAKDYQIEAFKRELKDENGFHGLIGNSPAMQKIYSLINNAAQSDAPVVILGESGTGKELVAKCIHDLDPNPKRPFVKVNCAALTESLLESELFGHVKGAYTGAFKNRQGRFELANGGDIFLDEIGDIPLSIQIKLLRVLDEKIIERVGDSTPLPIKVRIISATNRNLVELVGKGMFRDDLYFRINVVPIAIPPLRERPEDISLLADAFIERIRLKTGKPIHYISKNALEALRHYSWPGNVRELKGALEYAFVTCHEPIMRLLHLPMHIAKAAPPKPASLQKSKQPKKRVLPLNSNNQSLSNRHRAEFIKALDQANGNQSLAAEILGISRVTVWHRMKKYNISFDRRLEVRPPDMNQQES